MVLFKNKKAYIKKSRQNIDISNRIHQFLFEPVSFDKNFTVKELFLILEKNPEILKMLSRFDGATFIKEALQRKSKKHISPSSKIEFYWFSDPSSFELDGFNIPCVHGLNGRGKPFGLDFLPGSEIKHCRIKVLPALWVETEISGERYRVQAGNLTPTVGQVIYSLIWELSYWGPPKKRDQASSLSKEEKDFVEQANEPTMSIEELFESVRRERRRR